jgi:hypothetical protein
MHQIRKVSIKHLYKMGRGKRDFLAWYLRLRRVPIAAAKLSWVVSNIPDGLVVLRGSAGGNKNYLFLLLWDCIWFFRNDFLICPIALM